MAVTYEKIATTTLSSATATVTFSSISGAYTDLVAICNFGASSAGQDFAFTINGDTGTNYSGTRIRGNGTSASSDRYSNTARLVVDTTGVSTTLQATDIINIQNYSNTTTYKTVLCRANDASISTEAQAALWRSTAAVTSLSFAMTSGNLLSGSTFTLYGILKA